MQNIYIVRGRTGACSDRTDWDVAAYTDEEKALKHYRSANAKAKELGIYGSNTINRAYIERMLVARKQKSKMGQLDPKVRCECTGVVYYVVIVPILEEVPEVEPPSEVDPSQLSLEEVEDHAHYGMTPEAFLKHNG